MTDKRDFDNDDVTRRLSPVESRRRSGASPALVAVIVVLSLCVGGLIVYLLVGDGRSGSRDQARENAADTEVAVPVLPDGGPVERTAENVEPKPAPWRKLTPSRAQCDVTLAPQAGNSYKASNLLDGKTATAWAAPLDDISLDGESFDGPTFDFDKPVEIKRIKIRNGYGKSDKAFYDNARVGALKIYAYAENPRGEGRNILLYSGRLRDTREQQVLDVQHAYGDDYRVKNVFTVMECRDNGTDYYAGRKYRDICISEIEFWGR